MKILKTYPELFENSKTIRYVSNGFENCPVCDSDDYDEEYKNEYSTSCECYCEFIWIKEKDDIFAQSFDENNNPIKGGKDSCPYCDSDDYKLKESDILFNGVTETLRCNVCNKIWRREYEQTVVSALTKDGKEIKKGDTVDPSLFNFRKYQENLKRKKRNKTEKFNL